LKILQSSMFCYLGCKLHDIKDWYKTLSEKFTLTSSDIIHLYTLQFKTSKCPLPTTFPSHLVCMSQSF